MSWWSRLVNVIRSERLSKDIDRELAFHVEERVDELVASGMDEADARREAKRRLGESLRQRERTRDADVVVWLDVLVADVRHAMRALRASPAFSLVAILSLALGIGANTAIFSLIDAMLLESLPVHHPEELVRVTRMDRATSLTNPMWEEIRDQQDFLPGVFAHADVRFNLAQGGEVRMALGSWVSGGYFGTLGVQPAVGRLLTAEDDVRGCTAVAVLSNGFWRSEFGGDASVIGRTIALDGHEHTVVGVTEPRFTGMNVGLPVHVFAPLCAREIHSPGILDRRSFWYIHVMGRRAHDMAVEQVSARFAAIAPAVHASTVPPDWSVEGQRSYLDAPLGAEPASKGSSYLRNEYTRPLVALMAVVGMVLLIACVNVANLLLARASVRRRELAIRVAIGAGRMRLLQQILTESLLLSLSGAVIGVAFSQWGSRLLVGMLSSDSFPVQLDLAINVRVLAFTMLVATLSGILFGLAPAFSASRLAPDSALKVAGRGTAEGHSRFNAGKALVMAQVALSLVLLIGAGLLLGSFQRLVTLDAGFEREGVLLVGVSVPESVVPPEQRFVVQRELLERFRALTGVRFASASATTPIGGSTWNNLVAVDGYTPSSREDALVYFNEVSDDYFATLRTRVLAGRDFDERDAPAGQRVAIINQTMARKYFAEANPIGREFRVHGAADELGTPTRIIGVVQDAKYETLREATLPTAYLFMNSNAEPGPRLTYELLATGPLSTVVQNVKDVISGVDTRISFDFRTLEDQVASSLARERMLAMLSTYFGGLALLLAVIGLYGTLSYSVARRRKEIGVRLSVGAAPARILRMVLAEATTIVVIGLVVGVIAAIALVRLISSFLFGLSPTDPATIAFAAGLLTLVALAASALPAWRAANTDALIPLRED